MKKVILITGCSSGLGLALAKRLSKKHIIYATMRSLKKINESDCHFEILKLDVTEPQSISEAIQSIKKREGRLDVLINNAGIMEMGFFEDLDQEAVRQIFETNVFGVMSVTRAALPLLHLSKDAKIINISSSSGLMAMPALSAYAASKWALEGFSESLRFELKSSGIQVLLIEPGLIRTELLTDNFKFTVNETSKSAPSMKVLLEKWQKMDPEKFLDPNFVSEVIEKKIDSKHPSFRCLLSNLSKIKLLVKRMAPYSFYEWLILKVLGLPK